MTQAQSLAAYQRSFIDFLVQSGALTFGDFTTKSGRKTPYFINTGNFNNGERIAHLGEFYAAHMVANEISLVSTVFGPAYKGIPLAVTTSQALFTHHGVKSGFSFDRKESKEHGDKGNIVGHQFEEFDRVVIVEDVITAGTTLKKVVPELRDMAQVDILGVVVSVDRCERGSGDESAVKELESLLGIKIFPLVSIHDIVSYLSDQNTSDFILSAKLRDDILSYLSEYGA